MELPAGGLMRCLLSFNLGVEIGQLIVVIAALPLLYWLSRRTWSVKAQMALSVAILLIALGWFVERAFGLAMMPF